LRATARNSADSVVLDAGGPFGPILINSGSRASMSGPILMIEHRLELVEDLCDQVVVLAEGRTLARGTMASLREDPAVIRAYLGVA
jgi:ABC-type branched-subunit amino acid transport system ATPase component